MVKGKTKSFSIEDFREEDIYLKFFGQFKVGVLCRNHLRGDRNPSFIISRRNGKLRHYDFGDPYWRGDCIDLVCQIYRCSIPEAMKIIAENVTPIIPSVENRSKEVQDTPKKDCIITFEPKEFNSIELDYWSSFGITKEDLISEGIFVPKFIFRDGIRYSVNMMTFCYTFKNCKGIKIYRPFGKKPSKHINRLCWKWDSSTDIPGIENMENLKGGDVLLITKSRKDRMVLSKFIGIPCISLQSESIPISEERAYELKRMFKDIVVLFDNDSAGRKASLKICEEHGFKRIIIPNEYEKDPSDIIRNRGEDEFVRIIENLLNQVLWKQK